MQNEPGRALEGLGGVGGRQTKKEIGEPSFTYEFKTRNKNKLIVEPEIRGRRSGVESLSTLLYMMLDRGGLITFPERSQSKDPQYISARPIYDTYRP